MKRLVSLLLLVGFVLWFLPISGRLEAARRPRPSRYMGIGELRECEYLATLSKDEMAGRLNRVFGEYYSESGTPGHPHPFYAVPTVTRHRIVDRATPHPAILNAKGLRQYLMNRVRISSLLSGLTSGPLETDRSAPETFLTLRTPTPPVMFQQTESWINCAGTNDTPAFQSAIDGASSAPRTIKIPRKADLTQRCMVTTLTVPSNITIDNTDGSGIYVSTSITDAGPRINPPGKTMFFGPGSVTLTGRGYDSLADATHAGVVTTTTSNSQVVSTDDSRISAITSVLCAGTNDSTALIAAYMSARVVTIGDGTTCAADSTVTFPSNVTLKVNQGGLFKPVTGQTPTVQGHIDAGPHQIFTNILSGQGVVSFSGNTAVSVLDSRWWGAKWDDSTDDTVTIQATIDAMNDRTAMVVPSNRYAKTTAPLMIYGKNSPKFFSEANSGFYLVSSSGPGIDYRGADGTAAVEWYNSYGGTWDGIHVTFNHDAKAAQVGIDVDQFPGGTVKHGRTIPGVVNSANTFKNFGFLTDNNGPNAAGLRIAFTSGNNCEEMRIENVRAIFNGSSFTDPTNTNRGTAFAIGGGGGGANALNESFRNVEWSYVSYGIYAPQFGTSYSVDGGESQAATIDFYGENLSGTIRGFRVENGRQFLYLNSGHVTLISDDINGGGWNVSFPPVYTVNGNLIMIGNRFNDFLALGVQPIVASNAGSATFAGVDNIYNVTPTFAGFSEGTVELMADKGIALRLGGKTPYGSGIQLKDFQLAQAGINYTDGFFVYSSDVLPGQMPATTSGFGAVVARINGQWQALGRLKGSATLNFGVPGSVPGNVDLTMTVPGATVGDSVAVGAPVVVGANYILTAFASGPNTVTVRWTQIAGAAADPDAGGGTYTVAVWK